MRYRLLLIICTLFIAVPLMAQKLTISRFEHAQMDATASALSTQKKDANGEVCALVKVWCAVSNIKVKSPFFIHGEKMSASEYYAYFSPGTLKMEVHAEGFLPITVDFTEFGYEDGLASKCTYVLELNKPQGSNGDSEANKIYTQMVQFNVTPKIAGATILIRKSAPDGQEEKFGDTDVNGAKAGNLEYGTYTYRVMADNYHTSEGSITLNDKLKTHIEEVTLRPNFGDVTFTVDADADIYINGELKGHRTWSGRLKAGNYQVECRQKDHKASSQLVTVKENDNRTFSLNVPEPKLGMVAVNSTPLGANINIDGKDYGKTPRNVELTVGRHDIVISKEKYKPVQYFVDVTEEETEQLDADLSMLSGKKPSSTKLDVSQSEKPSSKTRKYLKPSGISLAAGYQVGSLTGPAVAIGACLSNVSIEAFAVKGMGKETFYALDMKGGEPEEGSLSPLAFGCKIGYGVALGSRLRLTPQVGYSVVSAEDTKLAAISTGSASVGAKLEYALATSLRLFAAPQYRFAVGQGEAFDKYAEQSSVVKGWGSGLDILVGLSVNF